MGVGSRPIGGGTDLFGKKVRLTNSSMTYRGQLFVQENKIPRYGLRKDQVCILFLWHIKHCMV